MCTGTQVKRKPPRYSVGKLYYCIPMNNCLNVIVIFAWPIPYHKGSREWERDVKHILQNEKLKYPKLVRKHIFNHKNWFISMLQSRTCHSILYTSNSKKSNISFNEKTTMLSSHACTRQSP